MCSEGIAINHIRPVLHTSPGAPASAHTALMVAGHTMSSGQSSGA